MNEDDIRTLAAAIHDIAKACEDAGAPRSEVFEAERVANSNPVEGLALMAEIASKVGVDYFTVGANAFGRVGELGDGKLTTEQRGIYLAAYLEERANEGDLLVSDVAEDLGVTSYRVRQMIQEGKLQARKPQGVWLVSRQSLERYKAQRVR